MKAREIMTSDVETIEPESSVQAAAQLMKKMNIGFLPICENDEPVGTITDRDITLRCVAAGRNPSEVKTEEIMTPVAFYCLEDDNISRVARAMQQEEVKRMLILNRDQKLVGVVSLSDIAKAQEEAQLTGETLREISKAA